MAKTLRADICVIGGGSGGLSVAAGAAQMGAKTVLIERAEMGGDCLNTGCVPSKAMIAAAHHARAFATGVPFGVSMGDPKIDFAAVNAHVHEVIAEIAPHDSVERFEGLGVTVLKESARFVDGRTVVAGDQIVKARRFVVATGSRASVPPIPGIEDVPYFTNETIFDNKELPGHLIVIGAGPIGLELAQAHSRLGARVTVLEAVRPLPKDEPELADIVLKQLADENVTIEAGIEISGIEGAAGTITVTYQKGGAPQQVTGTHLLLATGRKPNIEDLDLDKAEIETTARGITVDDRLRTSNKKVFAIGDVAGGPQFTHVANYHAGIVIRNTLFRVPAKVDYAALPWVTYTDPELAHVGETEASAKDKGGKVQVLTWELAENDRAHAERLKEGQIKVVLGRGGRIVGASIVGPGAGELILPWCLAVSQKMKIGAMANLVVPYPTLGEIGKRAAGSYYTPTLFSRRTRMLVRMLSWLG